MISKFNLRLMMLLPLLAALSAAAQGPSDVDLVEAGRRIYLDGQLPTGQPLVGQRASGNNLYAAQAACVMCHRRSGLGGVEGNEVVPPISGRALFEKGDLVIVRQDKRFEPGLSARHVPYDDVSFAAALRHGHHVTGREMNPLMPRYDLSDEQLQAVAAYLKTLSVDWSAGASQDEIHLATVIAPGVDDERRKAFITTLTTVVNQMNMNVVSGKRQKISVVERRLLTRRKLALDIWELSGPSSTWAEQLARRQQEHPVFAVVSGLAKDEWQPVQDFCEKNRVGCWFPSLELVPADAEQSRYSLYFSGGVATEANVVARKFNTTGGRIVQLVGADPVARGAAAALRRSLALKGGDIRQLADLDLRSQGATDVKAVLASLKESDTLVLWLRASDLAELNVLPAPLAQVLVSATLAGDEQVELPKPWRKHATLVQPLELPVLRDANLERFDAWLSGSRVPLVDRRMQSEVYFAARSLVSITRGMLNNLHTDYLIERAENSLSMLEAMQLQDEIQAMMMSPTNKRPPSQTTPSEAAAMAAVSIVQQDHLAQMRKRGGTTVYPHLSLAQGQRFASKGAYLERLDPQAQGVMGEPQWVVP